MPFDFESLMNNPQLQYGLALMGSASSQSPFLDAQKVMSELGKAQYDKQMRDMAQQKAQALQSFNIKQYAQPQGNIDWLSAAQDYAHAGGDLGDLAKLGAFVQGKEKKYHVIGNALVPEPSGNQTKVDPVYTGATESDLKGEALQIKQLTEARDQFPVGHPQRKIYEQALNKLTTFAPPAQVNVGVTTFNQASKLRDDYRADAKSIKEVDSHINTIQNILNQPQNAASDLALQKSVSRLYDTGTRASSEVAAWRNFGDLPTRFVGSLSRFATGQYTSTQRAELKSLIDGMQKNLVHPSINNLNSEYKKIADAYKIPADQVGVGSFVAPNAPGNTPRDLNQYFNK